MALVQGTLFPSDRQCSKCLEVKHVDEFYLRKTARGYLRHHTECKACISKRSNAAFFKNHDRNLTRERNKRALLREEMLTAYGGKCACCGISDYRFLTVDHVHGGGRKHQKEVSGSMGVFRDLKKRGWPKGDFECLCFNCNLAKGFYGVCPHKDPTVGIYPEKERRTHKLCPRCKTTVVEGGALAKPYCHSCTNAWRRERWRLKRRGEWIRLPDEPFGLGVLKRCQKCDLWKEVVYFDKYRDAHQGWCKECAKLLKNREKSTLADRRRGYEAKIEMVAAYGGKCLFCGETDFRFMTIDHVFNDGNQEKRRGARFYRTLKLLGFPKDRYQLLCLNCNCAKQYSPI